MELIKPVCPCKLNPINGVQATAALSQSQMPVIHNRATIRTHATNLATVKSFLPDRGPPYTCPPPPLATQQRITLPSHTPTHEMPAKPFTLSSSPMRHPAPSDTLSTFSLGSTSSYNHNTAQIPPNNNQAYLPIALPPRSRENLFDDNPDPASRAIRANSVPVVTTDLPSSSIPSLPCSGNSAQASCLISSSRTASVPENQREAAQPLFPSFEASSVYNMPNRTLEQVIGEIIHEDGFVQLVSFPLTVHCF
ncbi:hypothetical protein GALMADRAFT_249094 [Galerina marginata CBS 339.88]|uniref:Uncharacterized protein n=1 Tax=Galerina marginata (strain CBS 339.88) TaxID=685588 RepID=A0A067SYK2_GALM3|nr:hypothetical protein GALMADRAFT_249094 [Galerina marginata CBS 339.88]